jgi:hypothetical protein
LRVRAGFAAGSLAAVARMRTSEGLDAGDGVLELANAFSRGQERPRGSAGSSSAATSPSLRQHLLAVQRSIDLLTDGARDRL